MSEHTPGPWEWSEDRRFLSQSGSEDEPFGSLAILIVNNLGVPAEADARLVAAAPELLTRLEQLLAAVERGDIQVRHVTRAREAVAKAKGGAA